MQTKSNCGQYNFALKIIHFVHSNNQRGCKIQPWVNLAQIKEVCQLFLKMKHWIIILSIIWASNIHSDIMLSQWNVPTACGQSITHTHTHIRTKTPHAHNNTLQLCRVAAKVCTQRKSHFVTMSTVAASEGYVFKEGRLTHRGKLIKFSKQFI